MGGAVLVNELFAKLVGEVKALGGSYEDIFRLTTPRGRSALKKMAECVIPTPEELAQKHWRKVTIEGLELNNLSYNCLKKEGIQSVGELVLYRENELMHISLFGKARLADVKHALANLDLQLAA